jgi:DNA-nicking Smr family endonuclease
MTSGPAAHLKLEDRILWEKVARSTKPMQGRMFPSFGVETVEGVKDRTAGKLESSEAEPAKSAVSPKKPKPHPDRIDETTHRKLAKGRLALSGRIDLHGLTQGEAHGLLHGFLYRAHASGMRHVLVITGKGASLGSDGILRQAVPHWFSTPSFRTLVSAYEFAHRSHGGDGAIYVRLRRSGEVKKS